uniref:Myosin-light-chain kinase (Fragments) n=1 Tax=Meleagris gallopavo TaxID=9103 RepID=Q7LZH2_MELGA
KASGSSPTSPINANKVENTILDMEVVEGSAAIEGYPDPEVMWYHPQIDYDEEGNCSLTI